MAGLAEAGNDVVLDNVHSEPWRLLDCLAVMAGYRVVFVGVECDTTQASPCDCAVRVRDFLRTGQEPTAFDRLMSQLL